MPISDADSKLECHWELDNSEYLVISTNVYDRLKLYRQSNRFISEAGGLIYGFDHFPHLLVTGISEPQPNDVRSRAHWKRQDNNHIEIFENERKSTNISYLGEWHTHPEKNPSPSLIDLKEWQLIGHANSGFMHIFIIVGITHIALYYNRNGQIHKASLMNK